MFKNIILKDDKNKWLELISWRKDESYGFLYNKYKYEKVLTNYNYKWLVLKIGFDNASK